MKDKGKAFVILIAFDTENLDIIAYEIAADEDRDSWKNLLEKCGPCLLTTKGFYIDGDLDLVSVMKKEFSKTPIQLCVFHKEIRIAQIIPLVHVKTEEDRWLKNIFEIILYNPSHVVAQSGFYKLKINKVVYESVKTKTIFGILNRNFNLLMTHHYHTHMHRTNNVLEGFNGNISQKFDIMRGFKKRENIDRYVKLILLDYRFRKIKNSKFKFRNNKSPLELSGCKNIPTYQHWIETHITAR
jgi:transposase-like protein